MSIYKINIILIIFIIHNQQPTLNNLHSHKFRYYNIFKSNQQQQQQQQKQKQLTF
jgi:hypothetical protein